jgi:UDP-glucose 4-epimerase
MNILVAGGAGYIGTHSCVSLLQSGHQVIVVDSLINSRAADIQLVQELTGKRLEFIEADVRDRCSLNKIFSKNRIDAVINFAGYKSVGDSVNTPLDYYSNNLNCAIALLECMASNNVKVMVFSSSAAVYAEPAELPINESARTQPQSPYGRSKLYIEEMLRDVSHADKSWKIAILRYFNPVGAHPSGLIGEQSNDLSVNLFPAVTRVAAGEQEKLDIFGNDYDTPDGTAIRDYIHVMDLARGHGLAIQKLQSLGEGGVLTVNLGTGKGYSILEILKTFEAVCGRKIAFKCESRREGDMACCYADPILAKAELGWESELGIDDMCRDAWNWQMQSSKLD